MSKHEDHSEPSLLPFQVTPFVRDTCLCLHLQRAARAIARQFDTALRPVELTNGQFSLLMSLNRPKAPLMRDISELLAMDRTSLTAMLKPLERRGLVEIKPDPRDKRGRRLEITDAGRTLLTQAMPIWTATHNLIEGQLPSGTVPEQLRTVLKTLS